MWSLCIHFATMFQTAFMFFFSSENFANETESEFWRQSRDKSNQTKQDETEFIERNWRFYNKCCAPDKLNWCLENRIFGPRAHSNVCIQHHDVFSGLPMNKLWLIIKLQINGCVDMEQLVNTEHAHALLNRERAYAKCRCHITFFYRNPSKWLHIWRLEMDFA